MTSLALGVFGCGTPSNAESADGGTSVVSPPYDSGGSGDDSPISLGSTCNPGDVSSFIPTFKRPVGPYEGACSLATLATLATCFVEATAPSEYSACVQHAGALCASCVASKPPNPSGTPFLVPEDGATGIVDEGACIALSDPSQLTCALKTEYALECAWAACVTFCPIAPTGDAGDVTEANLALDTCFNEAWIAGCSIYALRATTCQDDLVGGPAAYCLNATKNAKDLLEYLSLACGPSPLDGGQDTGSAATDAAYQDVSILDASSMDTSLGDASPW
jgi:hypothetical protein